MLKESLRAGYNSLCEEYKNRLAAQFNMQDDSKNWYWIADNIGETLDMNDWVLNMEDIIRIVDNEMTFDDFNEWYQQWIGYSRGINLRSWLMGARPEMLPAKEAKQNKRVYISLPITHYDLQERIAYAEGIEKLLEDKGYIPVNPFNNGLTEEDSREKHMMADFKMLLECDYIYLCDGWDKSRGCLAEFYMAVNCGIKPLTLEVLLG